MVTSLFLRSYSNWAWRTWSSKFRLHLTSLEPCLSGVAGIAFSWDELLRFTLIFVEEWSFEFCARNSIKSPRASIWNAVSIKGIKYFRFYWMNIDGADWDQHYSIMVLFPKPSLRFSNTKREKGKGFEELDWDWDWEQVESRFETGGMKSLSYIVGRNVKSSAGTLVFERNRLYGCERWR